MKSENNSSSNDFQIMNPNNNPLSNNNQSENKSKISSNDLEKQNIIENQEGDEQNDFINFNVSFFLPKEQYKNIAEDEENYDNKNNDKINSNSLNLNQDNNKNYLKKINNFDLSKNNNFPAFQNIYSNYNVNKEIIQELRDNASNIEGNNIGIRYNINQGDNSFRTINNYNNYLVNNNYNIPMNFNVNNNPINNNNFYYQNNIDLTNYPQVPNNLPFYDEQNNLINQNIINNYIFNNNEIQGFHYQNQFNNNNRPLFKVNLKNNNKPKKKKVFDKYITQMFGRRGWICDLCNNFNYLGRKKCNRCHMLMKPRKIDEFYRTKLNNSLGYKNWTCKYCDNYNYLFRLVCNRCKAKK